MERNGLHFRNQRGRFSLKWVSEQNLKKKNFLLHDQFVLRKIAPLKLPKHEFLTEIDIQHFNTCYYTPSETYW